jgi:hypothetical protein
LTGTGAVGFGAVPGFAVVVALFAGAVDVALPGAVGDVPGVVVVWLFVGDGLVAVAAGLVVVVALPEAGFVVVAESVLAGAVVWACASGDSDATSAATAAQAVNPRFPSPIDPIPCNKGA